MYKQGCYLYTCKEGRGLYVLRELWLLCITGMWGLYIYVGTRGVIYNEGNGLICTNRDVVFKHVKRGVVYMRKERCGLYIQRVWLK